MSIVEKRLNMSLKNNEMRQVFAACEIGSKIHIVNSKGVS